MRHYPSDFSAVITDHAVVLTWSDEEGNTITSKLTPEEAKALGEDLALKGEAAERAPIN